MQFAFSVQDMLSSCSGRRSRTGKTVVCKLAYMLHHQTPQDAPEPAKTPAASQLSEIRDQGRDHGAQVQLGAPEKFMRKS